MADPFKGRAETEEGYRYKNRCAPAVAMRAGCDTRPVVRALGWVVKHIQPQEKRERRSLRWGRKSRRPGQGKVCEHRV